MYFIEETDKPTKLINSIFPKVILKDNKINITGLKENIKEKKSIYISKKIDKTLKKTNSNKIVLSKKIQENEVLKNMLYTYGYDIAEGKWLFEGLSILALNYIIEKKNLKKEECKISVLVNDLSDYTLENIKSLAQEYKSLNIVTNHIEKFKKIEQDILEEAGIVITITNNKKKSLSKSNIILNIDFPSELLNKYNVNDEAIIVNICGNIKINKKRFNGIVINDYEINFKEDVLENLAGEGYNKYYKKQIYEANFYKNIPYRDFCNIIKNDKVEICKLNTLNGEI